MSDVDNRAVPGTYEKTETGFVRLDEATLPAPAAVSDMAVEEAQAIIDATEASGFPPPPQAVAVIEAAAQAEAATKKARRAGQQPSGGAQTSAPVTPAVETKE